MVEGHIKTLCITPVVAHSIRFLILKEDGGGADKNTEHYWGTQKSLLLATGTSPAVRPASHRGQCVND